MPLALLKMGVNLLTGANGKVCLSSDLPYTKAVIQETFRISPVAPLGVPHYTTEDVSFMGYRVPKDTQVMWLILWQLHADDIIESLRYSHISLEKIETLSSLFFYFKLFPF